RYDPKVQSLRERLQSIKAHKKMESSPIIDTEVEEIDMTVPPEPTVFVGPIVDESDLEETARLVRKNWERLELEVDKMDSEEAEIYAKSAKKIVELMKNIDDKQIQDAKIRRVIANALNAEATIILDPEYFPNTYHS